jgi:hypothetical protein
MDVLSMFWFRSTGLFHFPVARSVNVAALLARAVFADKTCFIGEYGAGKQRRYIHAYSPVAPHVAEASSNTFQRNKK